MMDGAGTANATFEGVLSGDQDFYAVYPASAKVDAHYGAGTLQVTLPPSYTISGSMGTSSPLPMIAANIGNTLSFKHVGAVYRLTLDNVPAGTNKIIVTFDKDVTGTFTVTDPNTLVPRITTTVGTTSRMVTFNLDAPLTADTDGFVLNVPVPTGTYAADITVQATGGTKLAARIHNPRTIDRATGKILSVALSAPFGGPFEGLYLSQGDLYLKTEGSDFASATFALYSDPFAGYDTNYNKDPIASESSNAANRSYFDWIELGSLFSWGPASSTSLRDIDNKKVPTGIPVGYKIPTRDQWANIIGTTRTGATVNGGVDKYHYSLVNVDGRPVLVLILFPDGANITLSGTLPARDAVSSVITISEADYQTLDAAGCVFLPAAGYSRGSWGGGGSIGIYRTASILPGDKTNSYVFRFNSSDVQISADIYSRKTDYTPVRLLQEY